MTEAFICDNARTPIGRFGGALSNVRTDDLAAVPIKALVDRNPSVDWGAVEDVIYGDANQAGEDNRNVARMATLLAGLPESVAGQTVNRLCGSGMQATAAAARAIKSGEADFMIAGGVESMTRAPFVMGQERCRFFAAGRDLRYDHRLAFREPEDEGGIRCRLDAGNRRERRRGLPNFARRPRRLCRAVSTAGGRGDRDRPSGGGNRAGDHTATAG